jgi:hypothetical protein
MIGDIEVICIEDGRLERWLLYPGVISHLQSEAMLAD